MDVQREKLRSLVKGFYDIQKLRIATGNRIVAALRPEAVAAMEAASESKSAEAKEAEDKAKLKLLQLACAEYDRITDIYVSQFDAKGRIDKALEAADGLQLVKTKVDYALITQYKSILEVEINFSKIIEIEVKKHPLWDKFLAKVAGCGPIMSAVCIAYLDPTKAAHASAFWKYAGLDVVAVPQQDGTVKYEGRAKWHIEDRPYVDREGNPGLKKGITYNPELKTRLLGVLGSSFLRTRGSYYGTIYYGYRARLDNDERHADLSDIIKHRRATRYCVKCFLRDLWVAWREVEGLPVTEPYEVAYLGKRPHHYDFVHDDTVGVMNTEATYEAPYVNVYFTDNRTGELLSGTPLEASKVVPKKIVKAENGMGKMDLD